jgi:proline iminopeptidase
MDQATLYTLYKNVSEQTPALVQNGLSMYNAGEGEPLLLMPYPHGYSLASQGLLMPLLCELGRRVITFDPPGAYRSTRPAKMSMGEMLDCAEETLAAFGITGPLDVVGHSMGGLCAIAYALDCRERVRRLVLIGSVSGGPSIQCNGGMPWGMSRRDPDFWRFTLWGLRLSRGWGNLAIHKRLTHMIQRYSTVDQRHVPPLHIRYNDDRRPAPVRDGWPNVARQLDYSNRLGEIRMPTLVCAGRCDPQTPVGCSEELARGIPGAKLVIFERSGHYPFLEAREQFMQVVGTFLR